MRVSRVGDRSDTLISPKLQERSIRARFESGNQLEMLPPELDASGGDDTRPILNGAIERIERGELDGIVVWRLDRFARSLLSSLKFIERIEAVGGQLLSSAEDFDTSTPSGRMGRNFALTIAQNQREEAAAGFDRAKADAIGRGVYVAPVAPIGYVRGPDRRLVVDPAAAPVVVEVFRRRVAGESWRTLAEFIQSSLEREFLAASVRRMVRNRAYLGEARSGIHVNPRAHEPIVDRATFEAAQASQPRAARGKRGTPLLRGLVRCAGCQRRLTTGTSGDGIAYRCRRHHAGGSCGAPVHEQGAALEAHVLGIALPYLDDLAFDAEHTTAEIEGVEVALAEAEAELAIYQESVRVADVGAEHFAAGMRQRVAEVERLRAALAAARLAAPPEVALTGSVAEIWPELSVGERRHLLGSALSVVWVRRDDGPLGERVRLIAAGFAPEGLSGSGRSAGPVVALNWDRDPDGLVTPRSQDLG